MNTQDQEQERLLGYLLNALDDRETAQVRRELSRQPGLRSELARLQRELAPLDYIADSVEPPPQLADRICAKIWATVDNEDDENKDNEMEEDIDRILDAPAGQDSVLGTVIDPFKTLVNIPAASLHSSASGNNDGAISSKATNVGKRKSVSFWSSHWLGLTVSAVVGIAAAFFLFPMIRYAERSTRTYVTEHWMTEINRRVDQYEQIYSNPNNVPQIVEMLPFNLALNGWQELHSDAFTDSVIMQMKPAKTFEELIALMEKETLPEQSNEVVRRLHSPLLADFEGSNDMIPLETDGHVDSLLLVLPGQMPSYRSAFGQGILLKEGRVFFRTLPSKEMPKQ